MIIFDDHSFISLLLPRAFSTPDFSPTADPLSNLLLVFTSVIAAPLFEEYFFRGVCMMELKRYGNGFAILVTSTFLFALMHGNIPQAVPFFFFSLILCYADIRTGSLLPGSFPHREQCRCPDDPVHRSGKRLDPARSAHADRDDRRRGALHPRAEAEGTLPRRTDSVHIDFHFSAFFNNWASITLLVVLMISMALNVDRFARLAGLRLFFCLLPAHGL